MLTDDEKLAHIGRKNKMLLQRGLLKVHFIDIPNNQNVRAGVVRGNRYHQALADAVASWLHDQGLSWDVERWHAGLRCDIVVSGKLIIEVGNTDEGRAIRHLNVTDGKFCVVPFQDSEPLTMLVFERGPKWTEPEMEKVFIRRSRGFSVLDVILGKEEDASKLKPCPFCGSSQVEMETIHQACMLDTEIIYYVTCCDCGAEGPHQDSDSAAEELWNARPGEVDDSDRQLLAALRD